MLGIGTGDNGTPLGEHLAGGGRYGPDMPSDWAELASLGPSMCQAGYPAIVEFSTPEGTKVMLDG